MKLFKYEGFKVTIEPEALMLKPFRRLWERDRSDSKGRALSELAFIYFFADPRSDFMYILDDDTRAEEIKKQEGLKDSWEPDSLVKDALELYKKHTTTISSGLLEDTNYAITTLRAQLRNYSFDGLDVEKVPQAIKNIASAIKEVPELMKRLREAEKALHDEVMERDRMRGQGNKTIFEDGLTE